MSWCSLLAVGIHGRVGLQGMVGGPGLEPPGITRRRQAELGPRGVYGTCLKWASVNDGENNLEKEFLSTQKPARWASWKVEGPRQETSFPAKGIRRRCLPRGHSETKGHCMSLS